MDFDSLKSQVANLTLYDVKAGIRKVQNAVMNLTEMESKVREATNGDPWGASATLMQEIAQGTHNYQQLNEIMPMIYKRFTDKTAEEWRQIYKALQLLEFLVKNGSERVVDDARSHLSLLRMLRQFHYIDPNGKDQGVNVRNRSAELVKLLADVDTIRTERKKARTNKAKYGGVEGGTSFGMGPSSGRYGGFGSEAAGAYGGGYEGQVYGDGGGFGGQETDYSGTQRRGDQFEEYDEGDEGGASMAAPSRTSAAAPSAPPKRETKKAKEPEQDLLGFGDEPDLTPATSTAASTTLDADEDDFDDFQSATSPAVAQHIATNLSTLSPPSIPTSTTTSATQFAAPQPVIPVQATNINNILQTTSPTSSALAAATSPVASPSPMQPAAKPYRPSGPNYYTSVNAAINTSGSNASSAFSRPGMTSPTQSSYTSSTSMASLGKPAPRAASASGGGDAFGSLWSTASTKAGVKSTTPVGKGPDLASMAKAKSAAGIWGAPSAIGASTTPRPGAIAPSPNTATGQSRPPASLGNGLDDLLG